MRAVSRSRVPQVWVGPYPSISRTRPGLRLPPRHHSRRVSHRLTFTSISLTHRSIPPSADTATLFPNRCRSDDESSKNFQTHLLLNVRLRNRASRDEGFRGVFRQPRVGWILCPQPVPETLLLRDGAAGLVGRVCPVLLDSCGGCTRYTAQ